MHHLTVSIAIQHGTGGDLARVLSILARVIRDRLAMRCRIKAVSSEGRLTAVFLSLLPVVILGLTSITSPGYFGGVRDDPLFMPMFGATLVMTLANFLVLRRLVNFRFSGGGAMDGELMTRVATLGIDPQMLILAGVGICAALVFHPLAAAMGHRKPAAARLAQTRTSRANARFEKGLLRDTVETPKVMLKVALPTTEKDRLGIAEKFLRAGITDPHALRRYTLMRIGLWVAAPLVFVALVAHASRPCRTWPAAPASRPCVPAPLSCDSR